MPYVTYSGTYICSLVAERSKAEASLEAPKITIQLPPALVDAGRPAQWGAQQLLDAQLQWLMPVSGLVSLTFFASLWFVCWIHGFVPCCHTAIVWAHTYHILLPALLPHAALPLQRSFRYCSLGPDACTTTLWQP